MADSSAELRRIQEEIRRIEKEHRERLRSLRENYEARERKLRADFEVLLEKRGREAEETLNAALRRSEEELERVQKAYFAEIDASEKKAKKERDKYRAQMEKLASENAEALEKLRNAEKEREMKAHSACKETLLDTEEAKREAAEVPHEYFFPRQMELFTEELSKGRGFISQKMYEAAAAILSAAGLQMRTLREKTLKRQQEWETMYARYKALVISMYESLTAFREYTFVTLAGEFTLENDAIRDYWSSGAFSPIAVAVEKEYSLVRSIEENGHTAYLKKREPLSDYQVTKTIKEMEKLEKRMMAVRDVICAERGFSDERYIVGNHIADVYEEQGYEIDFCGFRDDNPTEVFEVAAMNRNAGEEAANDIHFTIVPERINGVTVRNRCIIWMGKKKLRDARLLVSLMSIAENRVREAERRAREKKKIVETVSGAGMNLLQAEQTDVPAAEERFKQEVSAGKLAEFYMKTIKLEMK